MLAQLQALLARSLGVRLEVALLRQRRRHQRAPVATGHDVELGRFRRRLLVGACIAPVPFSAQLLNSIFGSS